MPGWLYNVFVVCGVTLVAIIGDLFIKKATVNTGISFAINLGIGVVIYALVAFGFYYMYKVMDFSSSGVIYALLSILLYMAIGLVLYKENINFHESVGVVLAIISVYLMARFA